MPIGGFAILCISEMADVLTRPALAGAIVSFAVWLILASPRRFAAFLHCIAHGGPNGGHVRFEIAGEDRLERVSGHLLPVEQDVGPGKKLDFTIVYKGQLPSGEANDIVVTTTFTENAEGSEPEVDDEKMTCVKVELTPENIAPSNNCAHRHVHGVNEMVHVSRMPATFPVDIDICGDESYVGVDNDVFWCPWTAGPYMLKVYAADALLNIPVEVFAPIPTPVDAAWNGVAGVAGTSGNVTMLVEMEVEPKTVSFLGIFMVEIPDESNNCARHGYFADATNGPPWSHSVSAGAGVWLQVKSQGRWCADRAGMSRILPSPWSSGWKEWNIPVGWGDGLRQLRGQVDPMPTTQRFEIDAAGTLSITKYGHVIMRAVDNRVWVDGILQE